MANAYETAAQKVIPAVLLYAFHENKLLMIQSQNGQKKWNGLGGKLEAGESPLEASVREFAEESFCQTRKEQWTWLGQLYFPNFKSQKNEDWWVNVLVTNLSSEQAAMIPVNRADHPEGLLHWVTVKDVLARDLWSGDLFFLPYVFEARPFQGTFFYENGNCVRHEISAIIRP